MSKEKKIHLCFVCQYVYPVCPCDNKTKIVWGSEESGNEKDDRIISCEEHKPRIDMICLLNKKDERIKELSEENKLLQKRLDDYAEYLKNK